MNGLYDAKLDHQPVVAIVGQQARAALGGSYQQEVDLVTLFKDVASEYLEMIVTPQQVRHVVDRAVRIARAQRAPTCIIVPNDVQEMPAHAPAHDRRRDSQPGISSMAVDNALWELLQRVLLGHHRGRRPGTCAPDERRRGAPLPALPGARGAVGGPTTACGGEDSRAAGWAESGAANMRACLARQGFVTSLDSPRVPGIRTQ